MRYDDLSQEQRTFIDYALAGYSVLVDACIGSGKTTAIQCLCDCFPTDKKILYLTYNKLLKLDAKNKITAYNADVTNYHGFAFRELIRRGIRVNMQDCIMDYVRHGLPTQRYDVLILDEYQDIDQQISEMLRHIKDCNPDMQIIAVGDMAQKIYDRTRLEADRFIDRFLPGGYVRMEFTQCFRLDAGLAADLGRVWGKTIVGVNPECEVVEMTFDEAFDELSNCEPREILCLGANYGGRSRMLNKLEEEYPEVFNKRTVWSKISEKDGGATEPTPGCAVFTTLDGCKGMERDVCVVFDFTAKYWSTRIQKPDSRYEIIRNIFCVAASRGKKKIIFVKEDKLGLLTWSMLSKGRDGDGGIKDMDISSMFDFKFAEDVDAAYKELDLKKIEPAGFNINAPTSDCLIDLSPCIGIFTEANYFEQYDIDREIRFWTEMNPDAKFRADMDYANYTPEQKTLLLTYLETNQNRYWSQVRLPFISQANVVAIADRLAERLPKDAASQRECVVGCAAKSNQTTAFRLKGLCDVIHDGFVWELKFVAELSQTHFLQLAMYMIALDIPVGRLWNVRNGELWEVRIPRAQSFLSKAVRAATKGRVGTYYRPLDASPLKSFPMGPKSGRQTAAGKVAEFIRDNDAACRNIDRRLRQREMSGFRITNAMIEQFVRDEGLQLPVSLTAFVKHFQEFRKLSQKTPKRKK